MVVRPVLVTKTVCSNKPVWGFEAADISTKAYRLVARTITPLVPVPVSAMLKGFLLVSLLAMCSAAVFTPGITGVNNTVKKVLLPGLTGATGLVVMLNMAASVPSIVMTRFVRLALPEFVIVKVWLVLVPRATEPKPLVPMPLVRLVPTGCRTPMTGAGAAAPVPVRAMVKGLLLESLFAMCSAADFNPVLAGANWTVKAVLLPGFKGATGLVVTLNMTASVPSMVMSRPVRLVVPIFVIIKV